ncbi:MAG: CvpA family protein [Anaerolineales bacterium]
MIQLSSVLILAIFVFALIGYLRGFDKELIALSGIMLALFTLQQFDSFFVNLTSGSDEPGGTLFYVQALILLLVTFFAYQTPPGRFSRMAGNTRRGRDVLQNRLLGVLTGGFNGYVVFGSLWWFLDNLGYPLEDIQPPVPDSASEAWLDNLPLAWLLEGNLLTLFVIGLFLFILIAII